MFGWIGTRKRTVAARPYWTSVLVLAAWMAGASVPARAQLGSGGARVAALSGRVSLERAGELWVLSEGQSVSAGQVVVTGPDGFAQLELPDHSALEVFPNSRLILRPNQFNWRELLDLYLGKVRLQIQHLLNGDVPYRVTTPTAVISIRGTVLDVEVNPAHETVVYVETGSVGVRHRLLPGKEVTVESGQSVQVLPNSPLAAAKFAPPLVILGKVLRIAGDTLARVEQATGNKPGASPRVPSSSGGGAGASPPTVSGSDSGSNETAPPPGEDRKDAPPGDAIP